MSDATEPSRSVVNMDGLPDLYPTHRHPAEFWEALGRVVATFGFLEETLGRAIFAFTATREYPEDEIEEAFLKWQPLLERSLYDPLGGLIDTYGRVAKDHGETTLTNITELLDDLRSASAIRNVVCHGSWRMPAADGRSLPFFVNKKLEVFQTPIDIAFFNQLQKHVTELTCAVINSVTHMGWQFPGSRGPGVPVIDR